MIIRSVHFLVTLQVGLGDQIDKSSCCESYIDSQFEEYLKQELKINVRVHLLNATLTS